LHRYLADLQRRARSEKKRSLSAIVNDKDIRSAADLVADLYSRGIEHPKLDRLKTILVHHFKNNKKTNVMVFAHFRTSIARIVQELAKIPYVKPVHFIGQANKPGGKGLRQKEQLDILRKFRSLTFNTLVCSSVGEEGLDIPEVDLVIFYDAVPSEIRTIQRRGRTGRRRPGRVIMLVTKGTKDEGYYWAARHKEKKMRRILSDMHGPRQQSLTEFK
jgi:Fanconi anemia group M protein